MNLRHSVVQAEFRFVLHRRSVDVYRQKEHFDQVALHEPSDCIESYCNKLVLAVKRRHWLEQMHFDAVVAERYFIFSVENFETNFKTLIKTDTDIIEKEKLRFPFDIIINLSLYHF